MRCHSFQQSGQRQRIKAVMREKDRRRRFFIRNASAHHFDRSFWKNEEIKELTSRERDCKRHEHEDRNAYYCLGTIPRTVTSCQVPFHLRCLRAPQLQTK